MAINLHKPVFNPATGKYVPIDAAQVIDNFDQLAAANFGTRHCYIYVHCNVWI